MDSKDNQENKRIQIGGESINLNPEIKNVVQDIINNRIGRNRRSIDKFSMSSKRPEETRENLRKVSRSAKSSRIKNSSQHLSGSQATEPSSGISGNNVANLDSKSTGGSQLGNSKRVDPKAQRANGATNSLIGGMPPTLIAGASNLFGKLSPSSSGGNKVVSDIPNVGGAISDAISGNKDSIAKAINAGNIGNAVKNSIDSKASPLNLMSGLNEHASNFGDNLITKRNQRPGSVPNQIPIVSKDEAQKRAKQSQNASESIRNAALAASSASARSAQEDVETQSAITNAVVMGAAGDQKRRQMQASSEKANAKDGDVFNRAHENKKNDSGRFSGEKPEEEQEEETEEETRVSGKGKVALGLGAGAIILASIGSGLGTIAGGGGAITAMSSQQVNQTRCEPIGTNPEVDQDGGSPDSQDAKLKEMQPHFNGEIKENAYAIIESTWSYDKVPQDKKARAAVIALATATQESTLRNIQYGDKVGPDSRGLFQQRDSWGSLADRMNPTKTTQLFLARLVNVHNWDSIPLTQAAQSVQISGHPDAYAKWENWAKWVLQQYRSENGGGSSVSAAGNYDPAETASLFNLGFNWVSLPAESSDKFGDDVWQPPKDDTIWNQTQISDDIRAVYLRTRTNWPEIKSYGAYAERAKGGDHPKGNALDIMIPDYKSTKGISSGNDIADFFVANHEKYGITYIIWRNKMWLPSTNKWQTYNGASMYSKGEWNDTTLHMDHVHISVEGSGGNYELPDNTSFSNTTENGNTPDQVQCGDDPKINDSETINNEDVPNNLVKDNWSNPLPGGRLMSAFGPRACPAGVTCNKWVRFHYGLDISDGVGRGTGVGSPVYAPTKMKITHIRYKDEIGYGTSLLARSVEDPQYVFDFHHFAEGTIMVKLGDVVEAGTPIARAGTTGNSSGVHLHFQMMKPSSIDTKMVHDDTIDPLPILKKLGLAPK